ncbi:MAG: hypothetical protein NT150_03405 [Bacteroidetes bacterium]|nr:hypothetical protein [Bacteroidota bacterium]
MKRIIIITGLSLVIVLLGVAFLLPNRANVEVKKVVPSKMEPAKKKEEQPVENKKVEKEAKQVEKKSPSKKSKKIEIDYEDFGRGIPMEMEEEKLVDSSAVLP